MHKFKLAEYIVDFSRGEIIHDGRISAVEPKVLDVLKLLIEAKGEVLSQESIFKQVWPGSIFSQNYVQRCIAILRKLLGDDAKSQSIIVTHPKKGYSLNYDQVRAIKGNKASRKFVVHGSVFILLTTLIGFLWLASIEDKLAPIYVADSHLVNASEEKESQAYLIDEHYLSFVRDEKDNGQAIWLTDLVNQTEVRITPYIRKIESYQWVNSNTLLFANADNTAVKVFRMVSDVMPTKLTMGDSKVAAPVLLATLPNIDVFRGFYLTEENRILYLATNTDGITRLRTINLVTGKDTTLVEQSTFFKPYGFALNQSSQKVALVGFNQSKTTEVKLFEMNSTQLQNIATLDSNIYQVTWRSQKEQLLLTQGRKLKMLNLEGGITDISYSTTSFIEDPVFNEKGNQIAFTQISIDSDLWTMETNNNGHNARQVVNSSASDFAGVFSPSGKKIAFISNRQGFPQLYLTDSSTNETKVIYSNPERKLLLSPPIWHPTRELLASSLSEKLLLIDLENTDIKSRVFDSTSLSPLDWYKYEEALLVIDLSNNKPVLSKFDVTSSQLIPIEEFQYSVEYQAALIGPKDSIVKISQGEVLEETKDGLKTVFEFEFGVVENAFSFEDGVYLQTNKADARWLLFYSFVDKEITFRRTLLDEEFLFWDRHPETKHFIFEKNKIEQDIVLIELN